MIVETNSMPACFIDSIILPVSLKVSIKLLNASYNPFAVNKIPATIATITAPVAAAPNPMTPPIAVRPAAIAVKAAPSFVTIPTILTIAQVPTTALIVPISTV